MIGLGVLLLLAVVVMVVAITRSDSSSTGTTVWSVSPYTETPEHKGKAGEREVKWELSQLPEEEYIVLNDVLLPTNNGTTQLDHVVVSRYGIFVIETKNYSGTIYGGKNSDQWSQYIAGKEYRFRNPLKQNYGHLLAIAQKIHVDSRNLFPLVVFTGSATIRAEVGGSVVTTEWLNAEILRHREQVFTREQIERFAKELDDALEENEDTMRAHVDSVRERVSRRKQEVAAGLCPLCDGHLVLRKGKYGSFYGCSNYPRCRYTRKID